MPEPVHPPLGRKPGLRGSLYHRALLFALLGGGCLVGAVLASTHSAELFAASQRDSTLCRAIAERRPMDSLCPTCHGTTASAGHAFAVPVQTPLPAIAAREAKAESLQPEIGLQRHMATVGAAFVPLFLIFVGLSVRSVVRPVVRLTRAVREAEATGLPLQVPEFGADEVGELAHALSRWHARRLESLAETAQHRAALDREVILHEQELSIEQQRRALLRRVLSAQEEERRRIARDLHDTVAQDLAALRLEIERLSRQPMAPAIAARLRTLEEQTQAMHATARRILLDLRPLVLDDMGFLPALQWHLERVAREQSIRGQLCVDGDEAPLDRETSVTLFRIFQEALQNVVRHASADHVLVTVAFAKDSVALTVEDDGVGFAPEEPGSARALQQHLGLCGMRERAQLLCGTLEIDAKPGQGTTIHVVAPLSQDAKESPS